MTYPKFQPGDVVRFQAYTQEAAEIDYATGAVLKLRTDFLLLSDRVDVALGEKVRHGIETGRFEVVRRAPKDAYAARWTEDPDEADQRREWQ